jgi:hypothetical protein
MQRSSLIATTLTAGASTVAATGTSGVAYADDHDANEVVQRLCVEQWRG